MTNTQRYLNSIKGFRKDLQEVNDKFKPEYERLERFKDSGSYAQSKKLLDDRRELGRVVYQLNNEETQRVGVRLAGTKA